MTTTQISLLLLLILIGLQFLINYHQMRINRAINLSIKHLAEAVNLHTAVLNAHAKILSKSSGIL